MARKILVIDDDPDILDAMRFTLEGEGYTVVTSEKGEYAENLHEKKSSLPDLIVLDVLLSGKDGRSICKKIKSQQATKHIPVIMISAHPHAEKSTKDVGADAFLAKPFDIVSLLQLIGVYMQ